jgi:predicted KAP-like P-loop ATPase
MAFICLRKIYLDLRNRLLCISTEKRQSGFIREKPMSTTCLFLDEPVERAEQDALNRKDFANSVADLILTAPQGSCSQVIGLYGRWGEGKTSLKNMVLEAYKAQCKLPPLVVEFSPWT